LQEKGLKIFVAPKREWAYLCFAGLTDCAY
jgi:hypothetical protein